jgi:nucleotide-binding universal stress UspA family protein
MPRDFKTILCPTDFSEESYRAIEYGLRFAKASDGTLLLAHVIHVPSGELYRPDGHILTFDQARQRTTALLEELRQQRLGNYPKCELLIDIGDPHDVLLGMAKQRNADLIVIATHGRSGLEHLVMGNVAEKIIRHAPCPVFVVRRGAD